LAPCDIHIERTRAVSGISHDALSNDSIFDFIVGEFRKDDRWWSSSVIVSSANARVDRAYQRDHEPSELLSWYFHPAPHGIPEQA
jgi:hypothetical protein